MFLETSQDIFYIVLSFSVIWFTVFLCWLLYQAARFLRNANDIVESIDEKMEIITEAVQFIRERVDKATGHMGTVSKMVSKLVEKFVVGKLAEKFEEKFLGQEEQDENEEDKN